MEISRDLENDVNRKGVSKILDKKCSGQGKFCNQEALIKIRIE